MKEKLENFKEEILRFYRRRKQDIKLAICLVIFVFLVLFIIKLGTVQKQNIFGNINNMGFSVQKGKNIFYVGINDEGALSGIYKIKNKSKASSEKISDEYGLYLNASGNYIYYLDEEAQSIVKIKSNGEDKQVVIEKVDLRPFVVEKNWIYYFEASSLYRIKTNGQDKTKISDKDITYYQISDNWIYYSYNYDGKQIIARVNKNGKNDKILDEEASKHFYLSRNKIYYVLENYNYEKYAYEYELYSINVNGKNKEKITNITGEINTDTFNANKKELYYAKEDENGKLSIYKINLNGKKEEKIVELNAYSTSINVYDSYIYYTDIDESQYTRIYRIKTNGTEIIQL